LEMAGMGRTLVGVTGPQWEWRSAQGVAARGLGLLSAVGGGGGVGGRAASSGFHCRPLEQRWWRAVCRACRWVGGGWRGAGC